MRLAKARDKLFRNLLVIAFLSVVLVLALLFSSCTLRFLHRQASSTAPAPISTSTPTPSDTPSAPNTLMTVGEVETVVQRKAREFFAEEYERMGLAEVAGAMREGRRKIQVWREESDCFRKVIRRQAVFGVSSNDPFMSLQVFVVVDDRDHAFVLPDDLMTVLDRENLPVNRDIMLDIACLYIKTKTNSPFLMLHKADEIPIEQGWHTPDYKEPSEFREVVSIPTITQRGGKWSAIVYTWEKYGGVLRKWSIEIDPWRDITADIIIIAKHVGDYVEMR